MIDQTRSRPSSPATNGTVILSPADLSEAMRELELLRNAHRADLAERLRDARDFGTAVDDDDHLSVLEDVAVTQTRIAHLERLVASATVVETDSSDDTAQLGARVRVRDGAGTETDYDLVGRRNGDTGATQVTPASPVGEALLGSRPGDDVEVELPSGRRRALTVLEVTRRS